ncbi:phage late control D family protein [Thermaerobacillus caldiproteolyticus]|uniref:phage late control D family protein n=1 Tax=Thermaerobacillus caldiproteolyticus TaxID=247480 RepID=UPI00188A74AA|nr:contractile injection system protein, VgrG/Pvc8 family [Anoxybacillus caldiproteolyticus]QPA33367.1 hypothetical protein ISX45_19140 [Anoxybacillus caldiproteolyticus]
MENGRRVYLDIRYNNKNISEDLSPFITEWSHTDNMSGEADDISISLGDREKKWMGTWMPSKGASLKVTSIYMGWDDPKTKKKYLGVFEIDEIEISAPPSRTITRAISVPETSSLRTEKHRSWEKATLKKVAGDIAKANKMKFYFDSEENPELERVEQAGETDLRFLMKLCTDSGLALKVTNNSIAIFDEAKFESTPAKSTIKRSDERILEYQGRTTLTGTYRACRVEYTDPRRKKTIKYTFVPPKAPKTGRILVVNEQVNSQAQAIRLAKKRLREENKNATTFTIRMAGMTDYYAGQTVNLKEFGAFDGKYIITRVNTVGGQKTETTLELRKCLEGY